MNLVIAAGGTGGHIYPALAVAQVAVQAGHRVYFAGGLHGPERQLAEGAGLPFQGFKVSGFNRSKPWTLASAGLQMLRATAQAKAWLRRISADAVCTFGGYASLGVGRAAAALHLPLLLHEQNSYPGITNRSLAHVAQAIALSYQDALQHLQPNPAALIETTGNPVRQQFLDALKTATSPLDSRMRGNDERERGDDGHGQADAGNTANLLVFGGSQGAQHINNAIVGLYDRLMALPNLHVLLVTGPKEYERVQTLLAEVSSCASQGDVAGSNANWQLDYPNKSGNDDIDATGNDELNPRFQVIPYCDYMPQAMLDADLAVCRSGAGTLSELADCKLPAILVPYPYATADHQTANARSLTEAGACTFIPDADLDLPQFADTLLELLQDPDRCAAMSTAYAPFDTSAAAQKVFDLLLKVAARAPH
jgi:UDP-N-acetylglucosamine--N-acetylmuramyl-(pentapeptide) pyrophosphoryl-undecaprenol N-acetylglucosamine transferase